jgi:transcriptional regulator with XRE-family HTH domain
MISTTAVSYPKYTSFELSAMFREKRIDEGMDVQELSSEFSIPAELINRIESDKNILTIKEYQLISEFLKIEMDELLAEEIDDISSCSYRASGQNEKIKSDIEFANKLLLQMVMQRKIRANY